MLSEKKLAYNREYHRTHKEQYRAYDRKYCRKNSEAVKAWRRDPANKDKIHEITIQSRTRKEKFYELHRDEMIAKAKAYQKTPKGKATKAVCAGRRKVRIKPGDLTSAEWFEIKYRSPMCPMCGRFVECENLTQDHIIPLAKGGLHTKSNIQALCRPCNTLVKRDRMPPKVI